MKDSAHLHREIVALRSRLSRLSEASLRINESLEIDTVLQGVLDGACALTNARFGVLTTLGDSGDISESFVHGLTTAEAEQLDKVPGGIEVYEEMSKGSAPLRLSDFQNYSEKLGLSVADLPRSVGPMMSLLATAIRHRGERFGEIFVGEKIGTREFTDEDEEILVMFASQAALVIGNARRYREEQQARADLEALINTSPVGVVVLDAQTGELVSINREAKRIVSSLYMPNGSAEQLLKEMTIRRASGHEISLKEFPLSHVLSVGETVRAEEIVFQAPDGRTVTSLINATPIYSQKGEVQSFVITMQDLTPLEDMERMRAEFLGMVSHELRRPLSSIKGSATTLLEASSTLDPAEMLQFHRIINEQADYMRGMINDLLDVARIETGTLAVIPLSSAIADIVDDARNTFLSGDGRNNIRIDIPPNLPPVMADKRRVVQVLSNLLANAAAHSKESSKITVTAARESFHVAISVQDEGKGIPAERLSHLFGKFSHFSQEEGIPDGGSKGTGLGLAICKGIVEAHGGRIWAESDGPDQGSRFTFTLPAAEEATESSALHPVDQSDSLRQSVARQTRVLVVDDDPQTLRFVRDALIRADYEPLVTGDPDEALTLSEMNRPDLVLIDLMLPGGDGIELMKNILAVSEAQIIFLSGYDRDETIARALDLGAVDYVTKPFSTTELMARIRAALRKQGGPSQVKPFVAGDLVLDEYKRTVTLGGKAVQLTDTEYRLLCELAANAGRPLTHTSLIRRIWGTEDVYDIRPLRTVVKTLRRKLHDNAASPQYIHTVPRVGYRMPESETTD